MFARLGPAVSAPPHRSESEGEGKQAWIGAGEENEEEDDEEGGSRGGEEHQPSKKRVSRGAGVDGQGNGECTTGGRGRGKGGSVSGH